MNEKIKNRLQYLQNLAERGATDGEKKAASKAFQRLIDKYDITEDVIDEVTQSKYIFKYTSRLERNLLIQLCRKFVDKSVLDYISWRTYKFQNGVYTACKELVIKLNQSDYIIIECAYEYFRRHMNKEWKRVALPVLNRCRKNKTRNTKRRALQEVFYSQYMIASHLHFEDEVIKYRLKNDDERSNAQLVEQVEGGVFRHQINTGLYLED